jgi:hypothetical protein
MYVVYSIQAHNKTLTETVNNFTGTANKIYKDFVLYKNESGPLSFKGNPSYKLVYTFRGGPADICLKCKDMDILTIKNDKIYLLTYYGDIRKYYEVLPEMERILNSTNIGFLNYQNLSLPIELQYPENWSLNSLGNGTLFESAEKYSQSPIPKASFAVVSTPGTISGNSSVLRFSNSLVDYYKKVMKDFHLIGPILPINFQGNSGQILKYTFSLPAMPGMPKLSQFGSTIVVLNSSKLYTISYATGYSQSSAHYLPIFAQMIKSIKLGGQEERVNENLENMGRNSTLHTYENSTYRIRMSYPFGWFITEKNFPRDPLNSIVTFFPSPKVTLSIMMDNSPVRNANLHDYLSRTINGYKKFLPNFQLLESKPSSTLGNSHTYDIVYNQSINGSIYKSQEIGTVIGNDKILKIVYIAPPAKYEKWIRQIQPVIDSLEINIPTLKHETSEYTVEYPYNWAIWNGPTPVGYTPKDIIESTAFVSPIGGPYDLYKRYRIDIGYDSPYKQEGHEYPYTVMFYSNQATIPIWREIIEEWSLSGETRKVLYNETAGKGLIEEGKGYITIPLDMDLLRLPGQFYITSSTEEAILKDGQACYLNDRSDLVSIPPPIYSMSLLPGFLSNVRPGEEKNVEVQVKTNSTLPFDLSLSAKAKDLRLTFNPNNITGIPGGVTISNLRIKVLPNATIDEQHVFPIEAAIHLSPTFNPTNTSVANITKSADFTLGISPTLDWMQQISEAWNGIGPSLSGFVGLITAIVGVGGIIGGFLLRSLKGTKKSDDEKSDHKQKWNEGW